MKSTVAVLLCLMTVLSLTMAQYPRPIGYPCYRSYQCMSQFCYMGMCMRNPYYPYMGGMGGMGNMGSMGSMGSMGGMRDQAMGDVPQTTVETPEA